MLFKHLLVLVTMLSSVSALVLPASHSIEKRMNVNIEAAATAIKNGANGLVHQNSKGLKVSGVGKEMAWSNVVAKPYQTAKEMQVSGSTYEQINEAKAAYDTSKGSLVKTYSTDDLNALNAIHRTTFSGEPEKDLARLRTFQVEGNSAFVNSQLDYNVAELSLYLRLKTSVEALSKEDAALFRDMKESLEYHPNPVAVGGF